MMSDQDHETGPRPVSPRRAKGLVIVNTGEGKGKTSAALGILLRSWGWDMRVVMFQFIKSSTSNCGEHRAAMKMGIAIKPLGSGFTWRSNDMERARELALKQWETSKEAIGSGSYDVIVLDELTYAMNFGWVPVADVLRAIRERPARLHVVVTGRNAPQDLLEMADLVTEMREVKHPFRQGIKAQQGIDY